MYFLKNTKHWQCYVTERSTYNVLEPFLSHLLLTTYRLYASNYNPNRKSLLHQQQTLIWNVHNSILENKCIFKLALNVRTSKTRPSLLIQLFNYFFTLISSTLKITLGLPHLNKNNQRQASFMGLGRKKPNYQHQSITSPAALVHDQWEQFHQSTRSFSCIPSVVSRSSFLWG